VGRKPGFTDIRWLASNHDVLLVSLWVAECEWWSAFVLVDVIADILAQLHASQESVNAVQDSRRGGRSGALTWAPGATINRERSPARHPLPAESCSRLLPGRSAPGRLTAPAVSRLFSCEIAQVESALKRDLTRAPTSSTMRVVLASIASRALAVGALNGGFPPRPLWISVRGARVVAGVRSPGLIVANVSRPCQTVRWKVFELLRSAWSWTYSPTVSERTRGRSR
jgi:hypothetical protein